LLHIFTIVMLFSSLAFLSLVFAAVGYVRADAGISPPLCGEGTSRECSTKSAIIVALQERKPEISIFWGGHHASGGKIVSKADTCARKYRTDGIDAATIGMVLSSDARIAMPEKGHLWDYASKRFADTASGRVEVALGETQFDTTTFFKIELPILKLNEQVSTIVSIDVDNNCEAICTWYCNQPDGCPRDHKVGLSFSRSKISLTMQTLSAALVYH
jgi:hypothetical protein